MMKMKNASKRRYTSPNKSLIDAVQMLEHKHFMASSSEILYQSDGDIQTCIDSFINHYSRPIPNPSLSSTQLPSISYENEIGAGSSMDYVDTNHGNFIHDVIDGSDHDINDERDDCIPLPPHHVF